MDVNHRLQVARHMTTGFIACISILPSNSMPFRHSLRNWIDEHLCHLVDFRAQEEQWSSVCHDQVNKAPQLLPLKIQRLTPKAGLMYIGSHSYSIN